MQDVLGLLRYLVIIGEYTRERACDNPKSEYDGAGCVGDATETGPCNENSCPSMQVSH